MIMQHRQEFIVPFLGHTFVSLLRTYVRIIIALHVISQNPKVYYVLKQINSIENMWNCNIAAMSEQYNSAKFLLSESIEHERK